MHTTIGRAARWLALGALLALVGCDGGGESPAQADQGAPPVAPAALRVVFPVAVDEVACNGRLLPCAPAGSGCAVDLHAGAQGWPSAVVLCQAVQPDDVFAPVVPLVFKDGLPVWTPNLNAAGEVHASARTTAVAAAFLSPYLTATWPETARALLAQTEASPYLAALVDAVAARDQAALGAALQPVVVDVLAQATLQQPLTTASVGLGMDHIDVVQTSDYVHLEARLGTPINHICVVAALDECVPDSEVAFSQVDRAQAFAKTELAQIYVPSKSYFDLKTLARAALTELFGDRLPGGQEVETVRLTPGRVHDVQCYSGALGLLDEADARADRLLISSEPEGAYYQGFARVANLVSLAIDTLKLFVDFDAFGDQNDIAKAVSVCAAQALGPSLALADGTSREEWFELLKTVQGCAIRQLGIILAKRGVYALAALVLDVVESGGSGIVARVTRSGMILDRVAGMALRPPVQRQLIANAVDFEACAPCEDGCDAEGARRCSAEGGLEVCERGPPARAGVEGCLGWVSQGGCPDQAVCAEGRCVACGGAGEPCCALDGCAAGLGCVDGACVQGCRDTCPAVGATACADRANEVVCDEHDGDPCLEWGPAVGCAAGEICEAEACAPPSCEDECAPGAAQCTADGAGVEVCGQCDDDGCQEWCPQAECEAHFTCEGAECVCEADDLPDVAPGAALDPLDDSGVSAVVEAPLWPEGDVDIVHAYIADTAGNSLLPTVQVRDVDDGLTYDVCLAYACDPDENSGEIHRMDCGDAVRTTRDGQAACCLLSQQGPSTLAVEVSCTLGGLRDDSGTATVYLESARGTQCGPPPRLTLTGGED